MKQTTLIKGISVEKRCPGCDRIVRSEFKFCVRCGIRVLPTLDLSQIMEEVEQDEKLEKEKGVKSIPFSSKMTCTESDYISFAQHVKETYDKLFEVYLRGGRKTPPFKAEYCPECGTKLP